LRISGVDLDDPKLLDPIGTDLLDHLIVCTTCHVIFAAQRHSLGEAGCVAGRILVPRLARLRICPDALKEGRVVFGYHRTGTQCRLPSRNGSLWDSPPLLLCNRW
jgi:hypothetical protein